MRCFINMIRESFPFSNLTASIEILCPIIILTVVTLGGAAAIILFHYYDRLGTFLSSTPCHSPNTITTIATAASHSRHQGTCPKVCSSSRSRHSISSVDRYHRISIRDNNTRNLHAPETPCLGTSPPASIPYAHHSYGSRFRLMSSVDKLLFHELRFLHGIRNSDYTGTTAYVIDARDGTGSPRLRPLPRSSLRAARRVSSSTLNRNRIVENDVLSTATQ